MARNKDKPAPAIEPRCLTLQQAADYCALTRSGFSAWQRQGLVPGPIPGTSRWDRKALDFMHFETLYYVIGLLLQRLVRLCDTQ